jgi:hypothetical protein
MRRSTAAMHRYSIRPILIAAERRGGHVLERVGVGELLLGPARLAGSNAA